MQSRHVAISWDIPKTDGDLVFPAYLNATLLRSPQAIKERTLERAFLRDYEGIL